MASETYYYFFSILFVITIGLWIVNLTYLRTKGKTTFGQIFKLGSSEYKRVIKLASNRNLAVLAIIESILVGNLAYSTSRIVHLNTPDARFILVFAPISSLLFSVVMHFIVSKQSRNYPFNKRG
jgi:hypothetical protein